MPLIRIEAPHFCAGAVIENGHVVRAAPVLKWSVGWTAKKLLRYACGKPGYKVDYIPNKENPNA